MILKIGNQTVCPILNYGVSNSQIKKPINFVDYDGTILYSFTPVEWMARSTLPPNPTHTGLIAQGWNWTKAQIDAYLTTQPNAELTIGQIYATASGDTELDVDLTYGGTSLTLYLAVSGSVTISWGDGMSSSTVTGSSLTTRVSATHTFAGGQIYTISIHVTSGSFAFVGNSSTYIFDTSSNCRYLIAMRCGNSITLGNYALSQCRQLKTLIISPNTALASSMYTFQYCGIYALILPNSITTVPNYGCYYCSDLNIVSLSSTTITLGLAAFYGCGQLKRVALPQGTTEVSQQCFYNCSNLETVSISSSVTTIGFQAFYNCNHMHVLELPSGVTTLNASVFYYCSSLCSVTLSDTVASLGNTVFQGCDNMLALYVHATTPPTCGTNALAGLRSDCKIYVPVASVNTYKTASGWSDRAAYIVGRY